MNLEVIIDERARVIDVPAEMLPQAEEFFQKMDRDMDRGWQMSRVFVEHPDPMQRCQIAADKLLGALATANHTLVQLMAGYILTRMPGVTAVHIDTAGDMLNTEIIRG